jgi:hypothetical protein
MAQLGHQRTPLVALPRRVLLVEQPPMRCKRWRWQTPAAIIRPMLDRSASHGATPAPSSSTAASPPDGHQQRERLGEAAPGGRRWRGWSVFSTLTVVQLLFGVGLAVFGLLTVLDYLSLRLLLDETGPRRLSKVVVDLHAVLAHPGAQVIELTLALFGLTIVTRSLCNLLRPAE